MDRCVTGRVNVTNRTAVIIKEDFDSVSEKVARVDGWRCTAEVLIWPVYPVLSLIRSNARPSSIDMLARVDFVTSNYRQCSSIGCWQKRQCPAIVSQNWVTIVTPNETSNFLLALSHRDSMTPTANYFLWICRRFS